jgi:hypothetical protein
VCEECLAYCLIFVLFRQKRCAEHANELLLPTLQLAVCREPRAYCELHQCVHLKAYAVSVDGNEAEVTQRCDVVLESTFLRVVVFKIVVLEIAVVKL